MTYEYDKIYINDVAFPFVPTFTSSQNDVDYDSYTSTKGYTVRNRVRHDVKKHSFTFPTLTGEEYHTLLDMTKDVWFKCTFFDESEWGFVTKTMYRSGTVTYTKYYLDSADPNKNIYTDITLSLIEE